MTTKSQSNNGTDTEQPSRREFVQMSSSAALAAAMATSVVSSGVFAAQDNTIKIGLIGCGGRGGGAAINALGADSHTKLVALGDMFKDKLEAKLKDLKAAAPKQVDVPEENRFAGWDAYKGVINAADVVLLATPPHFRPMHVRAVIEAGKHCFCEKPVGVDAPGVRSVMETTKLATEKNVNLVSGLCYRYDTPKIETMKRIHGGDIGKIRVLEANYLTSGLWSAPRQPAWSDMEWQLRNWLYFTWLSGDHIVEQHIHSLDKAMWAMQDKPPMQVVASGGRIQRTGPEFGNVYDHFNTIYEWEDGTRCFSACRQWIQTAADVSDWVFGTDGVADVSRHIITGKNPWRAKKSLANMYDLEHQALFKAIRKGQVINNGNYMCQSTLMAIMGRMAAYTGKVVKWDEALNSNESLTPSKYEFGPLPVAPVAIPGSRPDPTKMEKVGRAG